MNILSIDPQGVIILCLGTFQYELFHVKLIMCYIIGGLGGIFGYYQESMRKKIKMRVLTTILIFFMTMLTIYLVMGALSHFFNIQDNNWAYFACGYFARYINSFIEAYGGDIIEQLMYKGITKATGIELEKPHEDKEVSQ